MKILYTADIHIRLGQKNIPKEWALERYRIMFEEFNRVYKEYNCVLEIHGGDIFDKVPSLEDLAIYGSYLSSCVGKKSIIMYDGNHEATKKGSTFLHLLEDIVLNMKASSFQIIKAPTSIDGVGDFIPYTHIKEKNLNRYKNNPFLFTHVRGNIEPHVKPEIDLDELKDWEIVFAGDLHSHSNCQRNIVYPGSPVTVTFHRKEVDTGVIVIDTETHKWEWVKINVPQLIRKTITEESEMVKTAYNHTIYEVVGDMLELSNIADKEDLLDKKIIKYESEAALDLKGLSLEEEIYLYLLDILNFNNESIEEILKVYNDNIKGINLE
jgi:DNA repair exonuclease SbcCD nuclease subunit